MNLSKRNVLLLACCQAPLLTNAATLIVIGRGIVPRLA